MSNIFGGNTGLTYEQAQRKRQIADAMIAGIGSPRNAGEGLSAIGKALAFRGLSKQADIADTQNRDTFNSKWGSIVGALQGGQGVQGGGASYMPPVDPNSPQAIGRDTMAALGKLPGTDDITSYIMQAASARGIDPSVAVEVARSEGLNADPLDGWQSNYMKDGKREESYGPFQLYMGGGLGNEFQAKTGLDPRDPMTWQQQVDFALDHAAQNGWGAWYGAGRVGIGNQQGIGGQPDMGALAELVGNPYANPGQQAVLQALLSQQIQGMAPPDPMKAIELEKAQLELDAMRNQAPKDARTDDMKEYEYYALGATARGETPMPFDQWMNNKKPVTTTNVTVGGAPGTPPDEEELMKALGKKEGESWAGMLEAGTVSAGTMQDMQLLDELITMAPQGPVSGRLASAFPGVNSAADAFNSVVKRVAPTLRAPGSGSTSDIEYDGMLKSLPQLSSRPEANAAISAMMKAKAQINMERSAIVSQAQNGEISVSDARKALREIDKRSIMTPELQTIIGRLDPGSAESAPDGIERDVWEAMTPEERALWQN